MRALIFLVFYLISAVLAYALSGAFFKEGYLAFENPSNVSNSLYYFLLIVAFTVTVILLVKISKTLVKFVFISLIFVTLHFVFSPFLGFFSIVLAALLTFLLIFKRNVYIINLVALLVSAGVIAIFGISLEPVPAIVLMIILAVYDYVSVYKTGHMVKLAESLSELELPLLFVVPGRGKNSYMGVGDVVIPNILFVSSAYYSSPLQGVFALIFSSFALLVLMRRVNRPTPGLPYLNTAAILGFLISSLLLLLS